MQIRIFIVLAGVLIAASGCVMEPYGPSGYGGNVYGNQYAPHQGSGYYANQPPQYHGGGYYVNQAPQYQGGGNSQYDYGRRTWGQ